MPACASEALVSSSYNRHVSVSAAACVAVWMLVQLIIKNTYCKTFLRSQTICCLDGQLLRAADWSAAVWRNLSSACYSTRDTPVTPDDSARSGSLDIILQLEEAHWTEAGCLPLVRDSSLPSQHTL